MKLLSTRISLAVVVLAVAFVFGVPLAVADNCNGNGIEGDRETLIRAGNYGYDDEVNSEDFAAVADDLVAPSQSAMGSAVACTEPCQWPLAGIRTP